MTSMPFTYNPGSLIPGTDKFLESFQWIQNIYFYNNGKHSKI